MDFSRIKKQDWLITTAIFLLMLIGIVVIYSSTFNAKTLVEGAGTINRQLVFVILGFCIYSLVMSIDPVFYRYVPIQILIFVTILGLLLFVWLFGDPVRNTNRWIEWGFIRIQPAEYAKIALILINSAILSKLFQKKVENESTWIEKNSKKDVKEKTRNVFKKIFSLSPTISTYILAVIVNMISVVLIMIEPALGNALITGMICFSLFLISFPKQKQLFGIVVAFFFSINAFTGFISLDFLYSRMGFSLMYQGYDIGIVIISVIAILGIVYLLRLNIVAIILAAAVGIGAVFSVSFVWNSVLKDYQKQRVEVFFNPEEDPQGAGWQLRQSKIAIGSGRLFGKGFLQGSQSKLRYLPEAYTDFVFAAYSEEFGLIGALFMFGVYIFLIIRIIRVAQKSNTPYDSLICFGVAVMLLIHVFINIGMNMGMLPITGIPLPLISYGGSSIMVTMIALGLVQAVHNYKDEVHMQEGLLTREITAAS